MTKGIRSPITRRASSRTRRNSMKNRSSRHPRTSKTYRLKASRQKKSRHKQSRRKYSRHKKSRHKKKRKQRGGWSMRGTGKSFNKWAKEGHSRLKRRWRNEPDTEMVPPVADELSQSDNKINIVLNGIHDATPSMIYELSREAWLTKYGEDLPDNEVKIDSMKMETAIRTEGTDIPKILDRWSTCEHREHGKKHGEHLSWKEGWLTIGPSWDNKGHHCGRCGRPICLEHQSTGADAVSFASSASDFSPSKWCENCAHHTEKERRRMAKTSKRGTVNRPSHKEFGLAAEKKFGREKSDPAQLPGTSEFWKNRPSSVTVIELPIPEEWHGGKPPSDLLKEFGKGSVYISVEIDPEGRHSVLGPMRARLTPMRARLTPPRHRSQTMLPPPHSSVSSEVTVDDELFSSEALEPDVGAAEEWTEEEELFSSPRR